MPYHRFFVQPLKKLASKWPIIFYFSLLWIMERFEPLFASIYQEKHPELEFCPELEISNIGNQNRSHFWHGAHNFWVIFSESTLVLVRY